MDYNQILDTVIRMVIIPIIPLLAVYIKTLLQAKIQEVENKITNENLLKQLEIAKEVLNDCVTNTTETYVKSLKEQGKFDLSTQKQALEKTKKEFLSIINSGTKEALETAYADYEAWIETAIEKIVKENK